MDIRIDVIIIVFMFAPVIMIRIGPNATFGREFNTVRQGSNTFDKNGLYHNIIANCIPNIDPNMKLVIVSYVVINMWLNKLLVLYRFIIVLNISVGDDVINVFIIFLSDRYCHNSIIDISIII